MREGEDNSDLAALVVFSDATALPWLRLLRPGFRHCFALLRPDCGWILYQPLSHYTDIVPLGLPPEVDLAGWYRQHGFVVVPTRRRPPPKRPAPWGPYSCVEAVKRLLGIHSSWVLTPWQLYRFLCSADHYPH